MDFSRYQGRRPSLSYSGNFGNLLIWYQRLPNDLVRTEFHKRGSRQGHLLQADCTTNYNNNEHERRPMDQIHNLEEIEDWSLY